MQDSQIPPKIPLPWGASAQSPYINSIPILSQVGVKNGAASFTDGFPPATFLALSAGGAGPYGSDTNGILNQITSGLQWLQAGGPIPFDSTFVNQIGGYPKQAVIASASTPGLLWVSTIDNNVNNPDLGGTGWTPAYITTKFQTQSFTVAGTYNFQVPIGVYTILCKGVGAGGGGAGGEGGSTWSSGGGGSGGYFEGWIFVTPGQIIIITIGLGGAGGSPGNGVAGNNGGSTSIGSFMSATGGGGAVGGTSTSSGGPPGLGTGASILNLYGANGGDGNPGNANVQGGYGASSAFGGGGRTSTLNIPSVINGFAPGSGGGGIWGTGAGGQNGGNGADGAVILQWITA